MPLSSSRRPTRSRISPAALLVKVTARIELRPDSLFGDQVGSAGDDDPGLAAARPGQNQQWPLGVLYSLALLWVQRGKQRHASFFILNFHAGSANPGPLGRYNVSGPA